MVEQALRRVELHALIDRYYVPRFDGGFHEIAVSSQNGTTDQLRAIYSGNPLILAVEGGKPLRRTLPATTVAFLLDALDLGPGMSVLEVGCRTGYFAALMSEVVGTTENVSVVDSQGEPISNAQSMLARAGYGGIDLLARDGFYGRKENGPFDRIAVSVGCADVSPHWLEGLKGTGEIVVPLFHGGWFPLVQIRRSGERFVGKVIGSVGSAIDGISGELRHDHAFRRIIRRLDSVVKEIPVWPELNHAGFDRLKDFWFFMAIRTHCASFISIQNNEQIIFRGVGLDDPEEGWGVFASGRSTMVGHPAVLRKISKLHDEWRELGSPRMADYELEFTSERGTGQRAGHGHAWLIKRPIHYERVWLDR